MLMENDVVLEKHEDNLEEAIGLVKKLGYDEIKSKSEGYDDPSKIIQKQKDLAYMPDITGRKNGVKSFFELGIKTSEANKVISKWKMLSSFAKVTGGEFMIFVPKGNLSFTNQILKDNQDIEADILKI